MLTDLRTRPTLAYVTVSYKAVWSSDFTPTTYETSVNQGRSQQLKSQILNRVGLCWKEHL